MLTLNYSSISNNVLIHRHLQPTCKMNSTISCAGLQPYQYSDGPFNTCAWTSGNYSLSNVTAFSTCCGLGNAPFGFTLPNAPPNCFQACNFINGTDEDTDQNSQTLLDCLVRGGAGGVYCAWDSPTKVSNADKSFGWSVIAMVGGLTVMSSVVL